MKKQLLKVLSLAVITLALASYKEKDAGTYSLNRQNERIPGSYWRGDVDIDILTDNTAPGQRYEFADGRRTVSKSNDGFTIDLEGTAVL